MLDKDTKQRINSARQILVGKVPDPKAQVEQITNALIYKFMDDMDRENEELGGKAQFLTDDLKEFSWGHLMSRELSGLERWDLYTRALSSFARSEQIPELFRTIFKDAYLPYRDPETLNLFLKEINGFSYGNSENLGSAFEYLLSILGSQGDAGQFRTPRHIIDFIVEVVNPQKTDRILDPACGTAGFLIASYKHIQRNNAPDYDVDKYEPVFMVRDPETLYGETPNVTNLSTDDRKRLANNIVGYDISPDMVRLSLVNLYLHGFSTPKIYEYDTLTYEERWGDNFDIILANPPFMTPKGGIRPHKLFQVSANRAEVLFVDYIAEHLTIHGKAGVIVPEGIIFQSANAYKALRKMLVEEHYLYAVVSLPAGVFQPYSGVKTSILFLDKTLAKRNDEILFVKVENDGFDLGAQRRRIEKNDLPHAFEILQGWQRGKKTESKLALWVKKEKIAENGDYNLTCDRYREAVDYSKVKWPMVRLGEVANLIGGFAFKSVELKKKRGSTKDYPVIKIGNLKSKGQLDISNAQYFEFKDELKKYLILKNDILIALTGATVGKVSISQFSNCLLNQRVGLIRANESLSQSFLKYLLLSDQFYSYCQVQAGGGAQGNISPTQVKKYQIPLPTLEVQKEIVAELDSYQKVIDGARQVAENWKPRIKINPDWPMVKLEDERYFKVESGGTPSSKVDEYWNGNINWVTLVDLPSNEMVSNIVKTERSITKLGLQKSSAKLLPEKSILVSSRATIGRIGIARIPLATNQGFKNIVIKDFDRVNENFVALMISRLVPQMELLGSGGTYKEISKALFSNLEIPLPPLEVQKQIVAEIEKEQKMVEECKKLIAIHERKIKDKIAEVWGE